MIIPLRTEYDILTSFNTDCSSLCIPSTAATEGLVKFSSTPQSKPVKKRYNQTMKHFVRCIPMS